MLRTSDNVCLVEWSRWHISRNPRILIGNTPVRNVRTVCKNTILLDTFGKPSIIWLSRISLRIKGVSVHCSRPEFEISKEVNLAKCLVKLQLVCADVKE